MLNPLVSVVVPCYNAERFLGETLASLFAQEGVRLQVIAVDDGSTDGTRALIEAQGDRVQPVFGPNRGAAAARNTGLAAAQGEFVLFLDADDLLTPGTLAARVAALTRTGAGLAYTDWQELREGEPGRFLPGACVARTLPEADPALALFRGLWWPPAALLWRRSLCDRVGGWKQELAPIEDARYMLDAALLADTPFVHVPGVGAQYRIFHGPSHSRRDPVRFLSAVLHNALDVQQAWAEAGPLSGARAQALADCYNYVARAAFRHDLPLFEQARSALRAVPGAAPAAWPRLAAGLNRCVGRQRTLRLLAWLGRPAP